jgi:hypothetical protein
MSGNPSYPQDAIMRDKPVAPAGGDKLTGEGLFVRRSQLSPKSCERPSSTIAVLLRE